MLDTKWKYCLSCNSRWKTPLWFRTTRQWQCRDLQNLWKLIWIPIHTVSHHLTQNWSFQSWKLLGLGRFQTSYEVSWSQMIHICYWTVSKILSLFNKTRHRSGHICMINPRKRWEVNLQGASKFSAFCSVFLGSINRDREKKCT